MAYFGDFHDRVEDEWLRQALSRVRLLEQRVDRMRELLRTHQWGAEGHCPECARDINTGEHTDTCQWSEEMSAATR